MKSLSAVGVVAMLFALAYFQPWSLLLAGEGGVVTPDERTHVSALQPAREPMGRAKARGCFVLVSPAGRRARPVCKRIYERRGGVETRLGKVRVGSDPVTNVS